MAKKAIVTIELVDGRKRKKITYTFLGPTRITFETIREMVETESSDDARIPAPFLGLKLVIESTGERRSLSARLADGKVLKRVGHVPGVFS